MFPRFTQCYEMKSIVEAYPLPAGEGGDSVIVCPKPVGVGELGAGARTCGRYKDENEEKEKS